MLVLVMTYMLMTYGSAEPGKGCIRRLSSSSTGRGTNILVDVAIIQLDADRCRLLIKSPVASS